MPVIEIGLTSSFPRSEEIVAATRELDRGRLGQKEMDSLYRKWTEEVLRLELKLGLSWTTGGRLAWQDLFRPLIESSQGMVAGSLTRWFETNTFYRRPVVEKPPTRVPGALAARLPNKDSSLTAILPGPWTFSGLAENKTTLDDTGLGMSISSLLAEEIKELAEAGISRFILQEPLLAARLLSPKDEKRVIALYEPLRGPLAFKKSILWTFFGDGAPVLPLLAHLPVGGIGVDLSDTKPSDIRSLPSEKALGLGCIDARTSLPEDPGDIADIVRELSARLGASSIVLGPGVPIDLLPWEAAVKKVEVLPEVLGRLNQP
jgi:5-methyltetrahydropteroyltriglutamate--homocysteine methyltransferase